MRWPSGCVVARRHERREQSCSCACFVATHCRRNHHSAGSGRSARTKASSRDDRSQDPRQRASSSMERRAFALALGIGAQIRRKRIVWRAVGLGRDESEIVASVAATIFCSYCACEAGVVASEVAATTSAGDMGVRAGVDSPRSLRIGTKYGPSGMLREAFRQARALHDATSTEAVGTESAASTGRFPGAGVAGTARYAAARTVRLRARLAWVRHGIPERPQLAQPSRGALRRARPRRPPGLACSRTSIISIGAVAVTERTRPARRRNYEALLRQDRSSAVDNILVHQIGGQQHWRQWIRFESLVACLEFVAHSWVVAFRADFDATVLVVGSRALDYVPGPLHRPGSGPPGAVSRDREDTLDEWVAHFGLSPIGVPPTAAIGRRVRIAQLLHGRCSRLLRGSASETWPTSVMPSGRNAGWDVATDSAAAMAGFTWTPGRAPSAVMKHTILRWGAPLGAVIMVWPWVRWRVAPSRNPLLPRRLRRRRNPRRRRATSCWVRL